MSIWVPVVVALVTGVVSWAAARLSRELSRRNLRTRIAADLAIYNGLGDEFRKRPLRESVDARLWQLAAQSMPLAPGSRPKPRIRRILALIAVVLVAVGALVFVELVLGIREGDSARVALALLAGALVGFSIPGLSADPAELQERQLIRALRERRAMEQLQNGQSSSAGTPPDLAETA
ncbi:hypothetical protein NXT08_00680 [Rhodococcus pyridinivorans]|uniref:hypothetical protein n=1 Tax=Rhodococcus TaxID=1827 RepID=UPI0007E92A1D|nr:MULTISPECIES: hypothetical protein [Rhodococcus]OBA35004.1 hypothetical protein A5767_12310 [Rhodococcus sp. 852002-51564_SCH6189132-a]QXF79950.1 hypothetical protein HBA53_01665 [Rhodococcus pyridinivorans]QXU51970.1 hypothetical protein KXC42_13675 [Rhodococcus sp. LW-XY12]UPK64685.1 hypothetical protein MYP14_04800 [Rhodococcus pyridinivorans]UVT25227.1 hypothetical protein NXT08_00680 [Rhodococcus pyridinivorans]